jgi:hypothetical protein
MKALALIGVTRVNGLEIESYFNQQAGHVHLVIRDLTKHLSTHRAQIAATPRNYKKVAAQAIKDLSA